MSMLTVTESCPVHIAHGGNIPLNCFDEATGAVMAILVESAETHEIVSLMRKWLEQEDNDSASLDFVGIDGAEVFVTYSV